MASKFSQRSGDQEIMDDLDCSGEVVNQTLRELEVINKWLGGNHVTIQGIEKLLDKKRSHDVLSIADIGCGGGDILKEISQWGKSNNIKLDLTGIDANPNIIAFARESAHHCPDINYSVQNIFSEDFKNRNFDIVVATLFTHHFTNGELVTLITSLQKQTSIGFVINDIHRHWLAYHSIRLLTKWFSKSKMVKYDAPLSVLRAFSRSDIESIMRLAGIDSYSLKWKWAFRWQLVVPASLA